MAHYLGKGIAMLVIGPAPEVVFVLGDIARACDKVGPIVRSFVFAVVVFQGYCELVAIFFLPAAYSEN
jgi:hypothetical protein